MKTITNNTIINYRNKTNKGKQRKTIISQIELYLMEPMVNYSTKN
jgi:hypothetical protein